MNKSSANDAYLAHVRQTEQGNWIEHSLEEHLHQVGTLAAEFATAFGGQHWSTLGGLWHDLGKYRPAFQGYIRRASGYDPEAHIEQGVGRVVHSEAGAVHAINWNKGAGQFLAYIIAGHHSGLPDWDKAEAGEASLSNRLARARRERHLEEALGAEIPDSIKAPELAKLPMLKPLGGADGLHLWLRMLFSCLVDADFLDTERFMNPVRAQARELSWSMTEFKAQFDHYMAIKAEEAQPTPVNRHRAAILRDCRLAAQEVPGIFTLTVPTGGGKTLSGMAFALEHAVKFQKQRIIVAIPYTSIIEQTAKQYRDIFGDAVLEHHSNLEPDKEAKEDSRTRLATENWDMPIVVTTNVQLLESLFAARTSRCRKLHNLVNSVILIDEAQLLPPDFLQPVLDTLRLLTEHYGVTLVLSTATQPALGTVKDSFGSIQRRGLDAKREIISDVDGLFAAMNRVEVYKPESFLVRRDWVSLASELEQYPSVLVIVNSRRDARELHQLLPAGTVHLSALMCGEHRSKVIEDIKEILKSGESVRVVSTQLVESGVDLDFPVVYRAMAGLDSIAQAAGRCNREGKLEKGKVVVFMPPRSPAKGMLLYGEQATRAVWHGQESNLLSHQLFDSYFRQYFAQESPDKHQILPLLTQDARLGAIQFRTAAARFQLIADAGVAVLVPYSKDGSKDGFDLLDQLRRTGPNRELMRKLQRLSVNVYENEFNALVAIGAVGVLHSGIWGVCVTNVYDKHLGLLPAAALYSGKPGDFVI